MELSLVSRMKGFRTWLLQIFTVAYLDSFKRQRSLTPLKAVTVCSSLNCLHAADLFMCRRYLYHMPSEFNK